MILEDWGLISYAEALEGQQRCVAERLSGARGDTLILCEHPEVVTVGRRLKGKADEGAAAVAGARLAGLPIVEVARGGQATLHLPGQLVGYPILKLEGRKRDLHGLLRLIEQALIDALATLADITAGRQEGETGVWIGPRKVASIGIAVRSWVSYHGFAINLDPDLARFQLITPCGLTPDVMTSVAREAGPEAAARMRAGFANVILERMTARFAELASP